MTRKIAFVTYDKVRSSSTMEETNLTSLVDAYCDPESPVHLLKVSDALHDGIASGTVSKEELHEHLLKITTSSYHRGISKSNP
jgi:hypothetical protein